MYNLGHYLLPVLKLTDLRSNTPNIVIKTHKNGHKEEIYLYFGLRNVIHSFLTIKT